MPPHTIVLAHGVLGFGAPIGSTGLIHYFNGVAPYLHGRGHEVFEPQVNPIGSVVQRGQQLADFIQKHVPAKKDVYIIAHSMGGLDARHAITNIFKAPEPVSTLVTIGTPHLGSPVADALVRDAHPLFAAIPALIRDQFNRKAPALHDLTTTACTEFDIATPDVEGVRYIEVAGNAAQASHELFLFKVAESIGRLTNEINDGVVTRSSALRRRKDGRTSHLEEPEQLPDWPVDHAGEVGWSPPIPTQWDILDLLAASHFARYEAIVQLFDR
ncbi:MAG TPA: hypothetical protein VLC46_18245 [Thermoanaerobaculia bacterium]|jgi:triacylglycerol lipase|nr:hypothetical protein [Thermoanaerobaculia bacterium]